MNKVITGDDAKLAVRLLRDGVPFQIPDTATVQAAIVSTDHKRKLSDTVTAVSTEPGAKWETSLVVILFPIAITAPITEFGPALIEIQVAASLTETWFIEVLIVKGLV